MTIQYSITMDRDRDGRGEEELNDDVLEMRWRIGMRQAYDSAAESGWARITVYNANGAFSPERNALTSGTRMRIQSIDGMDRRTHFSGAVSHVEPDEGSWGEKLAVIHLRDAQAWLERSPARLAPQIDVTADEVIAALLKGAVIPPRFSAGFCLLDVADHNLIDSARVFPPLPLPQQLQRGRTRFAYVGDWWRDSTSILQAIEEIAASERGRFYVNRDGVFVFLNRHHTLMQETLAASFADDMTDMAYSYGDQRLNRLTLLMRPRKTSAPDTLLWQLPSIQRIDARSETVLTLRPLDERGEPIGLLSLDRIDSRFQPAPEPHSPVLSADVSVAVMQVGSAFVKCLLTNRRREEVYLTDLRLFGQALYRRDPLEIVVEDGEGLYLHGLKQAVLDLPALSDLKTARAFANYEVLRRKHPRGTVKALQINAREHKQAALGAVLFDRIRIAETQTGHQAHDYFIIGEEHQVSARDHSHEVTWTLEPAESKRFVIVDRSTIDSGVPVLAPY